MPQVPALSLLQRLAYHQGLPQGAPGAHEIMGYMRAVMLRVGIVKRGCAALPSPACHPLGACPSHFMPGKPPLPSPLGCRKGGRGWEQAPAVRDSVPTFLNRIMAMGLMDQTLIFEWFSAVLDVLVREAAASGVRTMLLHILLPRCRCCTALFDLWCCTCWGQGGVLWHAAAQASRTTCMWT